MLTLVAIGSLGLFALAFGTVWLQRRFGGYERLPNHFDLRGRPDAFGEPWLIFRLVPAILGIALIAIFVLNYVEYDREEHGALAVGMLVASGGMIAALALTGWLLVRWERDGARLDR